MFKKTIAILVVIFVISALTLSVGAASEEYYIISSIYSNEKWKPDINDISETTETMQDKEYKNPASYPNYKYSRFDVKSKTEEQGENGFYYLWSSEFNVGGNYDVNKFKECIWSNFDTKVGCTTYGIYNTKNTYWWNPEPVPPEEYIKDEPYIHNFWWNISVEGGIVSHGDMTAAIKWVAPADGEYKLEAKVRYGLQDSEYDLSTDAANDGNIVVIYKNTEKLWSKESKGLLKSTDERPVATFNNNNKNYTLKQGDAFYFIADPKTKPYYDASQWKVKITRYISDATPAPTESITESPTPEPTIEATPTIEPTPEPTATPTAAPASSVPPADGGTPWGMIIGLVVIALAAIGGVLYYIFYIRKKANPVG